MKATTTEKKLTNNFNQIDNIQSQIEILQAQLNRKREENGELISKRANVLSTFYNDRLHSNKAMQVRHDFLGTGFYSNSYNYVLNQLKELLHEQTQSFPAVRTEKQKFRSMTEFVNQNSYSYYEVKAIMEMSEKYNTTNGKELLKYDRLLFKLRNRKLEQRRLLVSGRQSRYSRRKELDLPQRANAWYSQKVYPYIQKVEKHFRDKLNNAFSENGCYDLDFSSWTNERIEWYSHIALKMDIRTNTKYNDMVDSVETPLSMEMLRKRIYQTVKSAYKNAISHHARKENKTLSNVKVKAVEKHNLKTMKAKHRRRFNMDKWLKIKNTLNLFSGSLVIDKKITFDNYEPETPKEKTVKVSVKNYGQLDTNTGTLNLFA